MAKGLVDAANEFSHASQTRRPCESSAALPLEIPASVKIEHVAKTVRPMTSVPFIANTGFDAKGSEVLENGEADAIAYGTPYLANPDLVGRDSGPMPS